MAFIDIDLSRLLKIFDISIMRDVVTNLNYLFGQLGSLPQTVQNGGFEVDSDGNGQPDNVAITTFAGGSVAIDATLSGEGSQCLAFVHPGGAGAGGGSAEMDYIPCSELRPVIIGFIHWATVAGMHNQVVIKWSDKDRLPLSTTTIYDSTTNPTEPTRFLGVATPPADARFFKVQLVGGVSDTDAAGTAYFDQVRNDPADWPAATAFSFTIAESTSMSSAWTDVASATVQLPLAVSPLVLLFNAELKGGGINAGGDPVFYAAMSARMRFRVGAAYSNEMGVISESYVPQAFALPLQAIASGMQSITIYMQLRVDEHASLPGVNAYGRKAADAAFMRVDL